MNTSESDRSLLAFGIALLELDRLRESTGLCIFFRQSRSKADFCAGVRCRVLGFFETL